MRFSRTTCSPRARDEVSTDHGLSSANANFPPFLHSLMTNSCWWHRIEFMPRRMHLRVNLLLLQRCATRHCTSSYEAAMTNLLPSRSLHVPVVHLADQLRGRLPLSGAPHRFPKQ